MIHKKKGRHLRKNFVNNFSGLCKCIPYNPNGVMNHFAFFCDAICQFETAPHELEVMFQNLIFSYKNTLKERWADYFKLFPEKLKMKMLKRFQFSEDKLK